MTPTGPALALAILLAGCADTTLSKVNTPPTVSFLTPTDGALFDEGVDIVFVAAITDDHDSLDKLVYAWTQDDGSALIGQLEQLDGQVRYTVPGGLPDGAYTVHLTVTDADFKEGTDAVPFEVVDNSPPTASFASPTDGLVVSDQDEIDVDLVVSDAEEDDLNTLSLTWTGELTEGAPSTPTSDGHGRYTVAPHAPGAYTIEVVVSDSLGSTTYASVDVEIRAADADGDGAASVEFGGDDCDDSDPDIGPHASETCDGVDQDCDGETDEDAVDARTFYVDADLDGFGDADAPRLGCDAPEGTVADASDCDDTDDTISPDADEYCDGEDDDCDGDVDEDEAIDATPWYTDDDGDGYGTVEVGVACAAPPGTAAVDGDCADDDDSRNPSGVESCNGLDDDCDAVADDDASDASTWYTDGDGDGFGDAASGVAACTPPDGSVADDQDCDDQDPTVNPDADEACNGTDDDCDTLVDDDDTSVLDPETWYRDGDGDGFGDAASTTLACLAPAGYLDESTDCDDGDDTIHPGAEERCDSPADDNCDGTADDEGAVGCTAFYADGDADGYGDGAGLCLCSATATHTTDLAGDCDDADGAISPGAVEECESGADEDCDGFDAACPIEGVVKATTYDLKFTGSSGNLQAGQEVCFIPDYDGDGRDEVAMASVYATSSSGAVWVVGGDSSGAVSASAADAWITGTAAGDNFGTSMDAGDLNGDGLGDLLVGNHLADEGGGESGGAYAFLGPLHGGIYSADTYETYAWYGPSTTDYLGTAVAVIADADGDDTDEVAIGAIYEDDGGSNAGSVYVQFGPLVASSTHKSASTMDVQIYGEDANDYFGGAISTGGDFDGDGLEDLLIAAHGDDTIASNSGAIYVASGVKNLPSSIDAASLDWKFGGDIANDGWGNSTSGHPLAGGGDFDGDGYADFVVGCPAADNVATNAGGVYIITGRGTSPGSYPMTTAGTALYGESASDEFGYTVTAGADIDGDDLSDFVIGSRSDDDAASAAGAAYLYYGVTSGDYSEYGAKITGESASDEFGVRVRLGGDANGDGYGDVLVGAWYDDDGASNGGAAYLFSGAPR